MSKHDKVHKYEKLIDELDRKKKKYQEKLDTLKENLAELLFEYKDNKNEQKDKEIEKQFHDKSEEEKKLQDLYYEVEQKQKRAVLLWRNHLATNFENGHVIEESIILPRMGTGASSKVDTNWEGKNIPKSDVEIFKDVVLGEGSFGTVYKGMVYGNIVAVKRLKKPVDTNGSNNAVSMSKLKNSFENECRTLGELKGSPYVLRFMGSMYLDDDEDEQKDGPKFLNCCLLTEYADRGSLFDILYKNPYDGNLRLKFSLIRKFTAISQIVEGMAYLHSRDILHLDLKPSNILLDSEYNIRIADFGLSRVNTENNFYSVLHNFVAGTPYYMAPELLLADDPSQPDVSAKSDVYSFGILLNEFLKEEAPYLDHSKLGDKPTLESLRAVIKGKDANSRPSLYGEKDKDEVLRKVITSCWAFNPKDRPTFHNLEEKPSVWEKAKCSLVEDTGALGKRLCSNLEPVTKEAKIKVEDFVKIFRNTLKLENEFHKLNTNNQDAINLFLGISNRETQQYVDLVVVNRFLTWFKEYKPNELINAFQQVIRTIWFFGVLSEEKAEEILSKTSQNGKINIGAFLVRWDEDQFILSIIDPDKKIYHRKTGCKTISDLFQKEKSWIKTYPHLNYKKIPSDSRPLGYVQLNGLYNKEFHSSLSKYISNSEGTTRTGEPTDQERLLKEKGLPDFDILL